MDETSNSDRDSMEVIKDLIRAKAAKHSDYYRKLCGVTVGAGGGREVAAEVLDGVFNSTSSCVSCGANATRLVEEIGFLVTVGHVTADASSCVPG